MNRSKAGFCHIEYDYESVTIGDARVDRPSTISPGQWLDMWDDIMRRTRDCRIGEGDDGEEEDTA
jgi:hypothetical protein